MLLASMPNQYGNSGPCGKKVMSLPSRGAVSGSSGFLPNAARDGKSKRATATAT